MEHGSYPERISNTSLSGRLGVGGGGVSVCGALPTRISSWGIPDFRVKVRTISRAGVTSIMWVKGQVASPATVHSSSTLDNISPAPRAHARLSSWVDSTRILERSWPMSAAPQTVCGRWEPSAHIQPLRFFLRHQRRRRHALSGVILGCPPFQFGVVGRVVLPLLLGEPRRLGQLGS
jgi:hypothetical protein